MNGRAAAAIAAAALITSAIAGAPSPGARPETPTTTTTVAPSEDTAPARQAPAQSDDLSTAAESPAAPPPAAITTSAAPAPVTPPPAAQAEPVTPPAEPSIESEEPADKAAPPEATTSSPAVVTPQPSGESAPAEAPAGIPPPPSPTTSSSSSSSAPLEPDVVPPPPLAQANAEAVRAAKVAPAITVDAVTPPAPPVNVTANFTAAFDVAVRNEVNIRSGVLAPPVWRYVDYDTYHRPVIYNPVNIDLTYRYWYDGAYRTVWVPAGGRIVVNAPLAGVFPFTAVGPGGYVAVGSFCGGGWVPPPGWSGPPPSYWRPPPAPAMWNDVRVVVPAVAQSVVVRKVTMVSHDGGKPLGQQDTFMLDDSRLALGQVRQGRDGGEIVVNRSQATPGAGPMDDGGPIVMTTGLMSGEDDIDWTPWLVGALMAILIAALGAGGWILSHPRGGSADDEWATRPI